MEETILSYDDKNIDYSNITLSMPSSIHGGSYFTKLQYCKKPLYMQSPTCISKQGIVHSGKKTYIDLVFTSEKDGEFISFLENLEKKCIDIIYDKRHLWFTDDLEKTDIETAFASLVKSYKNGTSHTLRVNINSGNSSNSKFNNIGGVQSCFIFDEENNMLSFDSVKPETLLITIIDFEGIKFTSKSFQFEINARQMLIINEKPLFKACLIKQKKQEHNQGDKCKDGEQEQLYIEVTTDADTNANDGVVVSVSTKENVIEIVESSLPPNHLETLEHVEIVDSVVPPLEVVKELHLEELSSSSSSVVKKNDSDDGDNCNSGELIEVTLDLEKDGQKNLELVLKNPDDVYYKMYKDAKEKAKAAKNIAIEAYLAAEEIKLTYNLNNVDSSDSDDDSDDSDNDNDNDIDNEK
jgi:co-chaperonin GroES (HSP10)